MTGRDWSDGSKPHPSAREWQPFLGTERRTLPSLPSLPATRGGPTDGLRPDPPDDLLRLLPPNAAPEQVLRLADFARLRRLRPSDRAACLCRLASPASPGCRGFCLDEFPLLDHLKEWTDRRGRPAAITSLSYSAPVAAVRDLEEDVRPLGLEVEVDLAGSWWIPGTVLLVIRRRSA